jgi:hypothetical protein
LSELAIGTERRSDKDLKNCATELVSKKRHHSKEDSKMGALLGFIMGYYLGTKAGPERYEELRKAWQTIVNSEEFKDLLATGTAVLGSAVEQGGSMLFPQLRAMSAGNGEVAGAWKTLTEYLDLDALLTMATPWLRGVVQGSSHWR